ncbi:diacylglycerol/lipid kinase family protein [Myroides sp. LJL115]
MKKIHFIVNPISGKAKHAITQEYIEGFFDKEKYQITLSPTLYKRHAIELTRQAILDKADLIVACGGDGTIHEVATQMVGSNIEFGIIPVGSGNGLASNLNISKQIDKAMTTLVRSKSIQMDVGRVNGEYFFSNMGFGIDATIIDKYEKSQKRKLAAYIKAALDSAKEYKAAQIKVSYKGQSKVVNPLLLFISNSNQMGYNMSLTPMASLQDGLLDYLMVPKVNFLKQLTFGIYVLLGKTHKFRKTDYLQLDHLSVEVLDQSKCGLQLDGEYYVFASNKFEITVLKGALKVIC